MAYLIRKSDGTVLLTLADGQTDSSVSSLTFVGKNVSNFGEIQNNNYLRLLENFASSTQPPNGIKGQTWYDTTTRSLKVYDGGVWERISVVNYTNVQPNTTARPGYMWFNTATNQLLIDTGTTTANYTLIGPETIAGFGETKLLSESVLANDGHTLHAVIKVKVNGEVVGTISGSEFFVDSSNFISGIPKIYRGITLKNHSLNDFILVGRSKDANHATTSTNIVGGAAGSVPYQLGSGYTTFLPISSSTNHVLFSDGTQPLWKPLSTVTSQNALYATNLDGGVDPGALPYQSAHGTTAYLELEASDHLLVTGALSPRWASYGSITVGGATTASFANQLLSGASTLTNYISADPDPIAGTIAERDSNGDLHAAVFHGEATSARYADLAENYIPDQDYEPGTVVMIGGKKEITASKAGCRALGVISTCPAYLMNSGIKGQPVALKGRVPVKVIGAVKKGDRLIAADDGYAVASEAHPDVFAIALKGSRDKEVKVIEAVIL